MTIRELLAWEPKGADPKSKAEAIAVAKQTLLTSIGLLVAGLLIMTIGWHISIVRAAGMVISILMLVMALVTLFRYWKIKSTPWLHPSQ